MRSSATHCPHLTPLTFGDLSIAPDEKLEFVEHVLGVLIDSRFGKAHPYTQMFANVTLLTEAEIETHLDLTVACLVPFYVEFLRENHLRKRVVLRDGQLLLLTSNERSSETSAIMCAMLKPPAHAGGSPSRGSPTFLGRSFFASSLANFAAFAREKYFTQSPQRTQRSRKRIL